MGQMDGYAMGGFHLGFWLFGGLLIVIPAYRILRRMGFSGWWSLLTLFPLFNLIGLWLIAFISWPIDKEPESRPQG